MILVKNSLLYFNCEHCVYKFLNRLFKEILIVILLRRKVEPKYSTTDFWFVTTAKIEKVGPTFSQI